MKTNHLISTGRVLAYTIVVLGVIHEVATYSKNISSCRQLHLS